MGVPETISSWFNFKGPVEDSSTELPDIFPFAFKQDEFVEIDTIAVFAKILTDVLERVHGLTDDQSALLWDSCLKSSKDDGLVTMLSRAMYKKTDLFIVYEGAGVGVVREATTEEKAKIQDDYKTRAESSVGIFVSFKNFKRVDMIKMYSSLEFCTIASLYKNMNLAKAIQLKMSDLRQSVALIDSSGATTQAKAIAVGLSKGRDVLLDAKDMIVTATPALDSTKASIDFLEGKRAFYLGLPASYINGSQTGGMNATGDVDQRAIERGLRSYYFSIIKPVLEQLFGVKLKYKSRDTRQITQAMEALKTFALVDESLISHDQKKAIIESLLDIDPDENKTVDEAAPPKPPIALNGGVTGGNA